jgi:hypothetical protein
MSIFTKENKFVNILLRILSIMSDKVEDEIGGHVARKG